MANENRLAQAPEEPIPELDEFLSLFQLKFRRRESREATERYVTGLLTDHPNKNCDTLRVGHAGQGGQLSGDGQLPLRRAHTGLIGRHPAVLA